MILSIDSYYSITKYSSINIGLHVYIKYLLMEKIIKMKFISFLFYYIKTNIVSVT